MAPTPPITRSVMNESSARCSWRVVRSQPSKPGSLADVGRAMSFTGVALPSANTRAPRQSVAARADPPSGCAARRVVHAPARAFRHASHRLSEECAAAIEAGAAVRGEVLALADSGSVDQAHAVPRVALMTFAAPRLVDHALTPDFAPQGGLVADSGPALSCVARPGRIDACKEGVTLGRAVWIAATRRPLQPRRQTLEQRLERAPAHAEIGGPLEARFQTGAVHAASRPGVTVGLAGLLLGIGRVASGAVCPCAVDVRGPFESDLRPTGRHRQERAQRKSDHVGQATARCALRVDHFPRIGSAPAC